MIIRDATDADWPLIWPFFSAIVEAGETYAYPAALTEETAHALWMPGTPDRVVVAVDPERDSAKDAERDSAKDFAHPTDAARILGSAKMGPNRPGRGSHVATASFMVDPAAQGRGVGRALGEHVVEWARSAGFHSMQFNAVVETNTAAVALWQSLGFEILATVPEAFDHARLGRVGLHVMFHKL